MTLVRILGNPIPLRRARATHNRFYDPQFEAKKNWASEFMELFKKASESSETLPVSCPIIITVIFTFSMPKSWSKKKKALMLNRPHTQKPDIDNCLKFCFDALNEKLWLDDSQIFQVTSKKIWDTEGSTTVIVEKYD